MALGARIFLPELKDNVKTVLFSSKTLSRLHNCGNFLHVGDRGFFEGHTFTLGAVGAHGSIVVPFHQYRKCCLKCRMTMYTMSAVTNPMMSA